MSAEKTSVTEIIIWCSPAVFLLTIWLLNELYKKMKEDVVEIKNDLKTNNNYLWGHEQKLVSLQKDHAHQVERTNRIINQNEELKLQVSRIVSLHERISHINVRVSNNEENFGRVIHILDKIDLQSVKRKPLKKKKI